MAEPKDDVFDVIFGKKPAIKCIDDITDSYAPSLRLSFLRLSPSYNLAVKLLSQRKKLDNPKVADEVIQLYELPSHQLKKRGFYKGNQETFDADQRRRLLEGFQAVMDTAKKYGDLNDESKRKLRRSHETYLTSPYTNYPHIGLIGVWNERGQAHKRFLRDLEDFNNWAQDEHGFEPALVLLVPLRAPKSYVKKRVTQYLDEFRDPRTNPKYPEKLQLKGKRIHSDAILKKLKLLICRYMYPDKTLWELALDLNLSQEYTDRKLDQGELDEVDKSRLNIITSRMLLQAKTLAENAALGDFPVTRKIRIPKYDAEKTLERVGKIWPDLKP